MSSRPTPSNGPTSMSSCRACSSVAGEVATQWIESARAARAGSRNATVEPVPRPTFIPSSTNSAAASAATRFSVSLWDWTATGCNLSDPRNASGLLRNRLDGRALVGLGSKRDGYRRPARRDRYRHALHQHDPNAVDRRDPEGELRAPRNAHGDGPRRVHAVATLPTVRPVRSHLAEP